jgi:hypothetical protein
MSVHMKKVETNYARPYIYEYYDENWIELYETKTIIVTSLK